MRCNQGAVENCMLTLNCGSLYALICTGSNSRWSRRIRSSSLLYSANTRLQCSERRWKVSFYHHYNFKKIPIVLYLPAIISFSHAKDTSLTNSYLKIDRWTVFFVRVFFLPVLPQRDHQAFQTRYLLKLHMCVDEIWLLGIITRYWRKVWTA